MSASKRKGPVDTPLRRMITAGMEAKGFRSVKALEDACELPRDSIRDMMRGRTNRNRTRKLKQLGRVASKLQLSKEELAEAAGIIINGKNSRFDLGPTLQQERRIALARGGDPEICNYPLGVFAAWTQGNHDGISVRQHNAGCIFASLHHKIMGSDQTRSKSCLYRVVYPQTLGASLMDDPVEKQKRQDRYKAWFFRASNAYHGALGTFGSSYAAYNVVKMVALDEVLPPIVFGFDGEGQVVFPVHYYDASGKPVRYVDLFLRDLQRGLDGLADYFRIDE